ncbi:unnamed protein product [Owenia fusiformis]|uniref:Uncharacterized protein n=1 Tax=Owenia fusiformis TaxID=6347 RepID=A0A8J1UZG8_OWEFU|nr:unnamed protein product [Owenia fusiformis]
MNVGYQSSKANIYQKMARLGIFRKLLYVAVFLLLLRLFWVNRHWLLTTQVNPNGNARSLLHGLAKHNQAQNMDNNDKPKAEPMMSAGIQQSGMRTGLVAEGKHFYMDGQPIRILSGSFHYFRTPPAYWKDRLYKMKAAGLNTITTYIPWNLHEKTQGNIILDGKWNNIGKFIQEVEEVGLYLIIRPGPFICAEWEFGGLPYWLLRDPNMRVRTSYQPYLNAVERYFNKLLPLLGNYLYTKEKGPIVALQIENEYGSYSDDKEYLLFLQKLYQKFDLYVLHFTSDGSFGLIPGSVPSALKTINFVKNPEKNLRNLTIIQPNKPLFVAEFWSGWFDHWTEKHHAYGAGDLKESVKTILSMGSSINFYMFVGGSNWGFWSGANAKMNSPQYMPTVTSYDYDAPISEAGDLTAKYSALRYLFHELKLVGDLPEIPLETPKASYGVIKMTHCLGLEDLVGILDPSDIKNLSYVSPMEKLDINNNNGQGYGWIMYETKIKKGQKLTFNGEIRDRAQIFLNGKEVAVLNWTESNAHVLLDSSTMGETNTLAVLVENMGRANFRPPVMKTLVFEKQFKGILGDVSFDGKKIAHWQHIPLEFCDVFRKNLLKTKIWKNIVEIQGPAIYRGNLKITGPPKDTFISTEGWSKGIVMINSVNLGRYWSVGPQGTIYVPAPLLKEGDNSVMLFELHSANGDKSVAFLDHPILQIAQKI